MKRLLTALLLGPLLAAPTIAGWHFGEFKDLGTDVEYFDYAYKLPNGEPVYFIGSPMRYKVTFSGEGQRSFKNFQGKTTLVWAGDWSCTRFWLDNQSVSYSNGQPLPGSPSSGLRSLDIGKGGSSSFEVVYNIPYEICPGRAELVLEGRHRNESGREEVGSFRIPLGAGFKRRE